MPTPEIQSEAGKQSKNSGPAVSLTAIQKQKIAELRRQVDQAEKAGRETPPVIQKPRKSSRPAQPGRNNKSAPKLPAKTNLLYVLGLLLVLAAFFYRYQDILLQLAIDNWPVAEQVVQLPARQQQLRLADTLAANLIDEPGNLGQVVTLYQDMLKTSPEAVSRLEQLRKQCVGLASYFIAIGQTDTARQWVAEAEQYFPELADDPKWQRLLASMPEPAAPLASEPEPAAPAAIVEPAPPAAEAATDLTAATEASGVLATAGADLDSSSAAAITADTNSAPVPLPAPPVVAQSTTADLQEQATMTSTFQRTQQETINRLLNEARQFNQQGLQFTGEENAVSRYQQVLAMQPGQPDASTGLQALIDARVGEIKRLIYEDDKDAARALLAPALRYFPDNETLQGLSWQMLERGPAISALSIEFSSQQGIDPTLANMGGQTLWLAFSYKYFPTATTVVTARLVDLPGQRPIADVPVVIQEQRGSKNVQMNSLSRQIEDGAYRLSLSIADKQLIEFEFSVAAGAIVNNTAPIETDTSDAE